MTAAPGADELRIRHFLQARGLSIAGVEPDSAQRTSVPSRHDAGRDASSPLATLLLLLVLVLLAYHLGVVLLSVSLTRGAST
ncbi:hypothetical protein ACWCQE_27760 [Streptomyces sp. NPDC002409]